MSLLSELAYDLVGLNKVLSKLIKEAKPYYGQFATAMIFMFIAGISSVFPSWIVKIAIDGLAALEKGQKSFELLPQQIQKLPNLPELHLELSTENFAVVLPVIIVAAFLLEASLKFFFQLNIREIGLKVVKDLREKFHRHLNQLSLSSQAKYETGSLVSIVSSDLHNMQSWIAESMANLFNDGFKAFFLFSWLLILDWRLTLMTAVILPLFAIPVVKLGKAIRNYSRKGQDHIGGVASFITETLLNQKVIKAFNLESWRADKFQTVSDTLYKLNHKWVLFMAMVSPLTNIIAAMGIAVILYFGLNSVSKGIISVGDFSSFFVTSILLYDPVKRIGRVSTIIQSALGVAERVFNVLEEPSQEPETKDVFVSDGTLLSATSSVAKPLIASDKKGEIEFRDVDFSYPGKTLFENLNLKIAAGTSLALVGPSGGGKTTLVSLIPRFFEINAGSILIDGVEHESFSLNNLRSNIAFVTQEPMLFSGTIAENIKLGNLHASEKEIIAAAAKAHVLEFSASEVEPQNLEEAGLNKDVGERGSGLSIGQKQRVALARAFVSNAAIIILDEPTSALDIESEALVQDAIEKLMQSKTTLVIAHRLNTIEKCQQILHVENGKVKYVDNVREYSHLK